MTMQMQSNNQITSLFDDIIIFMHQLQKYKRKLRHFSAQLNIANYYSHQNTIKNALPYFATRIQEKEN